MGQEWFDIPGYEGVYQITKDGKVLSLKSNKLIKTYIYPSPDNYVRINLRKDHQTKICYIHRLLAETFIPNPLNKPCINHIDCNKENNDLSNLEWVTRHENIRHAFNNHLIGIRTRRKLDLKKVQEVLDLNKSGMKASEIAKLYQVSLTTVKCVIRGDSWAQVKREEVYKKKVYKKQQVKLTIDDVYKIRELYDRKIISQGKIAKLYKVDRSTISAIGLRKTHKNIPERKAA
jgi:hypothetical protein